MSKNIMLSSINEKSIRNLSTFATMNTELAKLEYRYEQAVKALRNALKHVEAEAKVVSVTEFSRPIDNYGETDAIEIIRTYEYSYGTCGIVNVAVEIFKADTERVILKDATAIRSMLCRYAEQFKSATADLRKKYNEAILAIVPEGAYKAYCYGMNEGSYKYNDKNEFSFSTYIARTCKAMSFLNGDNKQAVDKFTASIEVYFGGYFRRNRKQEGKVTMKECIRAMSETAFNQLYISAIINRLEEKAVLKLTSRGYVKIDKQEAQAILEARKTA